MTDQSVNDYENPDLQAVDVFTHSSTGFPGAWTEDEISLLLNAWEEAVKFPRPFDVAEKVLELLTTNGFRTVEKDEVWKQMSTLRTEYRTYLGLVKIGIPTVKGGCVSQLERILRRSTSRKARRRRTSTASTIQVEAVSEDDGGNQNGTRSQPELTEDENKNRSKRVRFQRQNLQRSVRTMISQQRTIVEHLQNVFKKIDESNDKIILLLGELVALQKLPDKIEVKEE